MVEHRNYMIVTIPKMMSTCPFCDCDDDDDYLPCSSLSPSEDIESRSHDLVHTTPPSMYR